MEKSLAYNRKPEAYFNRVLEQVRLSLLDDIGTGDITTKAVVRNQLRVESAIIVAKENGVLCGLHEAKAILEAGGLDFKSEKTEGENINKGEVFAKVTGSIQEILKRERTVLNYLQVLSGIATATNRLTKLYPKQVASLRKIHPGLLYSEKRAVKVGGGFTHRLGLYDGFLIKDNHLATVVKELFGEVPVTEEKKIEAIKEALRRVKQYRRDNKLDEYFIEIEVESLQQAIAAAQYYKKHKVPDIILLDNMKPKKIVVCIDAIRREVGNKILIESSGGITEKNIERYIDTRVDIVSTSKLTFSAKPLDMSMKIVGYK